MIPNAKENMKLFITRKAVNYNSGNFFSTHFYIITLNLLQRSFVKFVRQD